MEIEAETGIHTIKFATWIPIYSSVLSVDLEENDNCFIQLESKTIAWKLGALFACFFIIFHVYFQWNLFSVKTLFTLFFAYLLLWLLFELVISKKFFKIKRV